MIRRVLRRVVENAPTGDEREYELDDEQLEEED